MMSFILADAQAWWQSLLMMLFNFFVQLAVPVLVTLLLVLLNKWLHVKLTEKQREMVDTYVDKAINYAEQKLKKVLKEGEPPKDPNAARMQWAREFLEQTLTNTGLLKKAEAKLEDLIESKLGSK